jgi:hypothetical protein
VTTLMWILSVWTGVSLSIGALWVTLCYGYAALSRVQGLGPRRALSPRFHLASEKWVSASIAWHRDRCRLAAGTPGPRLPV